MYNKIIIFEVYLIKQNYIMFRNKKYCLLIFVIIFSFFSSGCFIFRHKKKCDCPTWSKAKYEKIYITSTDGRNKNS